MRKYIGSIVGLSRNHSEYTTGKVGMTEYFWAKTTCYKLPGKSVLSHMNDVKEVAKLLLKKHQVLIFNIGAKRQGTKKRCGIIYSFVILWTLRRHEKIYDF